MHTLPRSIPVSPLCGGLLFVSAEMICWQNRKPVFAREVKVWPSKWPRAPEEPIHSNGNERVASYRQKLDMSQVVAYGAVYGTYGAVAVLACSPLLCAFNGSEP